MARWRLLCVGFALLGVAWMFSTPPFQAPDEQAQYLRALTISRGHLIGPKVPIDPAGEAVLKQGTWHAQQERWILHDRRGLFVPAPLSPPLVSCVNGQPDLAGCEEASYTGDYYPLAYFAPAAGLSFAHDASGGLWIARATSLGQSLLFLLLAVILLGPGIEMLGLAVAATPLVFFISSVANPSGLDVAANLAFVAGLTRLNRASEDVPRWVVPSVAVSGAVAILSWQLGPLFVACDLAVFAILMTRERRRTLLASRRRPVALTAGLLVAAVVAFVVYGSVSGTLHSTVSFSDLGGHLHAGLQQLGLLIRGEVGRFGAYDVPLPTAVVVLWLLLGAGLWIVAFWRGAARERIALAVAIVLALAVPVCFYALAYINSGFGLQGRYALALFELVPLAAASVIRRHQTDSVSAWTAWLVGGATALTAALQLVAWWVNARHWSAGGILFRAPAWSPPIGWWPTAVLAILGAVSVVVAAVGDLEGQRPRSSDSRCRGAGQQRLNPAPEV